MNSPSPFSFDETASVIKGLNPCPIDFRHMPRWLSHALGKEQDENENGKTLIHIRHGRTFANAANKIAGGELSKNPREKDDFQILLDIIIRLIQIRKQTGTHGPYIDAEGENQADNLGISLERAWDKNSKDIPTNIIVSPLRRTRQTLIKSVGRLLDHRRMDDILDINGDDKIIIPWKGDRGEVTIETNKNTAEIDGYLSLPLPSKMREMFLGQKKEFIQWVKQVATHGELPESISWEEILSSIEEEILYESLGSATARGVAFLDQTVRSPHTHTMAFNHCDFIRQQIAHVLGEVGKNHEGAAEQLEHIVSPKNCTLTALAYHGNKWHLVGHNIKTNIL